MRFAVAVMVAFLLLPGIALAQDSRTFNEKGIEAFQDGRFAEAAENFGNAAERSDDPLLRKNEAVAWFKAKQCQPAIEAANAFLDRWEKDDSNREEASAVVANCKVTLADQAIEAEDFGLAESLLFEAAEFAPDDYTRDRISATRVKLSERRHQTKKDKGVTPPPDETTPAESQWNTTGIWIASGGLAVVALAAGYHVYTLAETVPALEDEADGGDPGEHDALAGQVDTARWLVPTLYGVGAAGTGIGIWIALDGKSEEPTRTSTRDSWTYGISYSASF